MGIQLDSNEISRFQRYFNILLRHSAMRFKDFNGISMMFKDFNKKIMKNYSYMILYRGKFQN